MSTGRGGVCSNRDRRISQRKCAPSVRRRGTGGSGRTGIVAGGAPRLCFRVERRPSARHRAATWPVSPARLPAAAWRSNPGLLVPPHASWDYNPYQLWRRRHTELTEFSSAEWSHYSSQNSRVRGYGGKKVSCKLRKGKSYTRFVCHKQSMRTSWPPLWLATRRRSTKWRLAWRICGAGWPVSPRPSARPPEPGGR